jgi:hypothetical protein
MQKQFSITIVTACIILSTIAQACGGQGAPAIAGKPPAEGESIIILVENTSISLPVRELKSDKDRIMEWIHSWLNSVLEGKVR